MVKSSPESVRSAPDSTSALEALRRSEERSRLMVSSVRDYAIFLLDTAGRVESWNAGAEAIKGYKPDEILGHHISFFYTPEDLAADRPQRLLHLAAQYGRIEDEGWRVRKDGTRFWADVVITALYDSAGKLQGYTKVTRDLTARREAEEALRQSESHFRMLLQSAKDHAIFMLDPEGRVTTWNPGASRIKATRQRKSLASTSPSSTHRKKWPAANVNGSSRWPPRPASLRRRVGASGRMERVFGRA